MTKKNETPAEAVERIAPTPGTFSLSVSGHGEQVDTELLRAGYEKFVRTVRRAGFTVGGFLTGSVPARRVDDELVPAVVIHESVADVDLE
jgi:hypothetical protein